MVLYANDEQFKLYHGSMLDMLDEIEPNSIDSIVTDPPYEIEFMNKGWDGTGIAFQKETWEKCLRALKPGGHLLAFGGTRTFHRIACAIEDAGFEIRDTMMWIFGQGFPKSMNIGKAIEGKLTIEQGKRDTEYEQIKTTVNYSTELGERYSSWGTTLKPAYEPIIVARKPCEGTCVDTVIKYGTGGINIDECRVPTDDVLVHGGNLGVNSGDTRTGKALGMFQEGTPNTFVQNPDGRFPANVILTYDDSDFDEVCGGFPVTKSAGGSTTMPDFQDAGRKNVANGGMNKIGYNAGDTAERKQSTYIAPTDSGSAARYFYCAKASKRDRDEGLDAFETKQCTGGGGGIGDYLDDVNSCSGKFGSEKAPHKNIHPTVKPTSLMQYLVRLVTPKGGIVLDPFNGSGSTGKAVMWENRDRDAGYKYIGIELSEEYLEISEARIKYAMTADIQDEPIKPEVKQPVSDKKHSKQSKPSYGFFANLNLGGNDNGGT